MNYSCILFFLVLISFTPHWGFFAHRKINELAVYTLPPEMKVFFTPNQDYFSRHAIDADKRRYASTFEAPRHYIDLDQYGGIPFEGLKRDFRTDLRNHCTFYWQEEGEMTSDQLPDSLIEKAEFKIWFDTLAMDFYYEEDWLVPLDQSFFKDSNHYKIRIVDGFTEHGVLPYNLSRVYHRLTDAFRNLDAQKICRYAADLGHYLGDATVPLHTSSNYNGQQTGQYGIHAFWESRLPEYFAKDYKAWVGQAVYINNVDSLIWTIITESHALVDEVLEKERFVRAVIEEDLQYGVTQRGERLVTSQSDTLTVLYHEALGGMVESRYRRAIHALGSLWYSSWVDAGMPDLHQLESDFDLNDIPKKGRIITRRVHFE